VTRTRAVLRWVAVAAGNTFGLALIVYAGWMISVPLGCALAGVVALGLAWLIDKE
jgi:hypothetical protein